MFFFTYQINMIYNTPSKANILADLLITLIFGFLVSFF